MKKLILILALLSLVALAACEGDTTTYYSTVAPPDTTDCHGYGHGHHHHR